MDEWFKQWATKNSLHGWDSIIFAHNAAKEAWLESARRADRKAREECERIALQYSQAYGQMDDAMAVARDIRATIKEE